MPLGRCYLPSSCSGRWSSDAAVGAKSSFRIGPTSVPTGCGATAARSLATKDVDYRKRGSSRPPAGFSGAQADRAAATVFTFVLGNVLGVSATASLAKRRRRASADPRHHGQGQGRRPCSSRGCAAASALPRPPSTPPHPSTPSSSAFMPSMAWRPSSPPTQHTRSPRRHGAWSPGKSHLGVQSIAGADCCVALRATPEMPLAGSPGVGDPASGWFLYVCQLFQLSATMPAAWVSHCAYASG
jgi:hypothetical protein